MYDDQYEEYEVGVDSDDADLSGYDDDENEEI